MNSFILALVMCFERFRGRQTMTWRFDYGDSEPLLPALKDEKFGYLPGQGRIWLWHLIDCNRIAIADWFLTQADFLDWWSIFLWFWTRFSSFCMLFTDRHTPRDEDGLTEDASLLMHPVTDAHSSTMSSLDRHSSIQRFIPVYWFIGRFGSDRTSTPSPPAWIRCRNYKPSIGGLLYKHRWNYFWLLRIDDTMTRNARKKSSNRLHRLKSMTTSAIKCTHETHGDVSLISAGVKHCPVLALLKYLFL